MYTGTVLSEPSPESRLNTLPPPYAKTLSPRTEKQFSMWGRRSCRDEEALLLVRPPENRLNGDTSLTENIICVKPLNSVKKYFRSVETRVAATQAQSSGSSTLSPLTTLAATELFLATPIEAPTKSYLLYTPILSTEHLPPQRHNALLLQRHPRRPRPLPAKQRLHHDRPTHALRVPAPSSLSNASDKMPTTAKRVRRVQARNGGHEEALPRKPTYICRAEGD